MFSSAHRESWWGPQQGPQLFSCPVSPVPAQGLGQGGGQGNAEAGTGIKPRLPGHSGSVSLSSLLNSYLLCHRKLSSALVLRRAGWQAAGSCGQMPQDGCPSWSQFPFSPESLGRCRQVIHPRFNTAPSAAVFPSNQTQSIRGNQMQPPLQQIVFLVSICLIDSQP